MAKRPEKRPKASRGSKVSADEVARRASRTPVRYARKDYEAIADALGVGPEMVMHDADAFEDAARWFFLDQRGRSQQSKLRPSEIERKLKQIAAAANRLLSLLEADVDSAPDGPGCREIFDALIFADELESEDVVAQSMAEIAKLVEVITMVRAAREVRGRSRQAAVDVRAARQITVPQGYRGDEALSNWTARLLEIYQHLTRSNIRKPFKYRNGTKLYAFLDAAARPLGIEQDESQWRDRVKSILRALENAGSAPKWTYELFLAQKESNKANS